MDIVIKEIKTNNYLSKSKLPTADYVINPYVGCTHACKYCYASFMKRFTNHPEKWGEFLDVKICDKKIDIEKLKGKNVFLSSVTDCYNQYEKKYKLTRNILKELQNADCEINISTKSNLILRDLDILKKLKNVKVCMSINTTDEKFQKDMDKASSISKRFATLKTLHENGIYTILFMSPIFPFITDYKKIITESQDYIDEYWFENLNLRGAYKKDILDYIKQNYPQYYNEYVKIYIKNDRSYWENLALEMDEFAKMRKINFKNYFYHEKIRKK